MEKDVIGLLIALVGVTGGLGLPFFALYQLSRERLALIEKGMDPNLVRGWPQGKSKTNHSLTTHGPLMWGFILVGIGLGILIGSFISYYAQINNSVLVNGTAVLFGGFSLLGFHSYQKKHDQKKPE